MSAVLTDLAWGAAFGALVGGGFFAVLWLSVRRAISDRGNARWLFIGLVARLALVVSAGIVLIVVEASAVAIVAAALGFTVVRMFAVSRVRSSVP